MWSGTIEETRRITAEPVPKSYRDAFAWTGCQNLDKASLVDWHLAFGTEASTAKALRFLAETAVVGLPSPDEFATTLRAKWRAVLLSPTPEAARALVEAHQRFAFLADQYVRAAAFFRSPTFLAAATPFLTAANRGLDVIYHGARIAMAQDGSAGSNTADLPAGVIDSVRDLQMRYAITQARISGSKADWARAGAVVGANMDPAARDVANVAFDGSGDYCQSERATARLKEACNNENNFSNRVRAVWLNAELVAQFTDGAENPAPVTPPDGFDVAMAVISNTARPGIPDVVRYDMTADDEVQLRLARAESLLRKSRALPVSSWDRWALCDAALTDLDHAERLVPPVLNPNRFRQIASLYLQIFGTLSATEQRQRSERVRQAAYFRTMLPRLGAIADGL